MKTRWIISIVALFSAIGAGGSGRAAPGEEPTANNPASCEAPANGASADAASFDPPLETPDQSCRLDNCLRHHDPCTCSNTGWAGYCGTGPHHPGCLYCRCD
ncbi:hypothetical protein [Sorangium sp. So ce1182]|uniref:hypothetical protein n=1 Tax=Sorangium sp. So ce1182 TaxID=3133334 RepID=UPI003F5FE68A